MSADSGLMGLGAMGAARSAGVAALAAQLLNREAHNLGSISNSLEDVALVMLASPRTNSRLQPHSHQQQGQVQGLGQGRQQQQEQSQGPGLDDQQQQQVAELTAALVAAEAANQRQRAVISALRHEMEELQTAGEGWAVGWAWMAQEWCLTAWCCLGWLLQGITARRQPLCKGPAGQSCSNA